jgi:hypothetical protein
LRASRNPPSVLGEIPLSSQPGQVQEPVALFGLAPSGSAVSFQYREPQVAAIIVHPDWISFLFRCQPSPANCRQFGCLL